MFSEIMFMMFVLSNMLESCMLGLILVMLNLVWNLNLQLSIFPTKGWLAAGPLFVFWAFGMQASAIWAFCKQSSWEWLPVPAARLLASC